MKLLPRIIVSLLLLLLVILGIGLLCFQSLVVTEYTVALDGIQGNSIRVVLLSDLHERLFGEKNCELINLVRMQNPDIIVLAGDLFSLTATEEEILQAYDFASQLVRIAPTYYSRGNHESEYVQIHGEAVLDRFIQAGIILLNDEYLDLNVNGSTIRLGGMDRYAYRNGANQFDPDAEKFLLSYCNTDLPTVLLSHRPEAFSFKRACSEWDIDLILSGHTHGGLVRLPFVGGLVAPIQGFFPKTVYGEYTFYDTKMIVTSGLAGYGNLPRVFNPPEVCVITLINQE